MNISDQQKIRIIDLMGLADVPQKVLKQVLGLYSLSDVALKLKVQPTTVIAYVRGHDFPSADVTIGRRKYWTEDRVRKCVVWLRNFQPWKCKWKPSDLVRMKEMYAAGKSQWDIADEFGLCQSTVSRLLRGVRQSRRAKPALPR
jgi:hypothetical protein